MYFEKKEERRLFTYEERDMILKSSYGKCAACGKPLTTKTMTVEHIIPISRGGSNEMENLVALCEPCNKRKDNLLYTASFYIALLGTPRITQIRKYIIEWFLGVKENFDIETFPLISPRNCCLIDPVPSYQRKNKLQFHPGTLYQIALIGKEYYDEIEAVTDLNIRNIRQEVRNAWEWKELSEKWKDTRSVPVSLYALRKYSNDKILAVYAISYIRELKRAIIQVPWCIVSKKNQSLVLTIVMDALLESIIETAGYELEGYMILTPYYDTLRQYEKKRIPFSYGYSFDCRSHYDPVNDEEYYSLYVERTIPEQLETEENMSLEKKAVAIAKDICANINGQTLLD